MSADRITNGKSIFKPNDIWFAKKLGNGYRALKYAESDVGTTKFFIVVSNNIEKTWDDKVTLKQMDTGLIFDITFPLAQHLLRKLKPHNHPSTKEKKNE